ncbi:hypothetical protein [Virgibacillus halodenitrificans]|uniref:SWIM-type domain-containing protein n=2 Tax=Virgibacillus halodenitrificans TaxID=1482 RepID=A0ABR7VJA7_VIRHA|nr:hypothetical protein [Virgibacillus halodenitrificans]MBD1222016.1 hypothetical protein [Virgibacillus halodenitrificans]MEC2158823.1 hypothetical protein [Virgibacillus halodenitrificans]MYL56263.1 hypothetical protein [Virgibacillus halodenitrificans]
MGVYMKYFIKVKNSKDPYQIFEYKSYEIPFQEIMLIKKHTSESVTYALYSEEGMVYLLTKVVIRNNCICGYGNYSRPYCRIEEINNYSLDTLDKDAYNWYMTQAR